MGPARTDKRTKKKQPNNGRANTTTHASREKENINASGRTSANPTGDHGSGRQTNLEQELAEVKGKDIGLHTVDDASDMPTARLEEETAARKAAERRLGTKKAAKVVPKPQGCFGENYSIQEEMKLSDNKGLYKTILVSAKVCVII
jgi:hypothetical protein